MYRAQQSIQTQTGASRVRPAAASIKTFSDALEKIGDQWQKAEVTNQYTTAKNENEMAINSLMAEAEDETDHTKRQEYIDRLQEISGRQQNIDDIHVQEQFNSNKNLLMSESRIRLEGAFKQKMISHQRGEIIKDGSETKKAYMTGFSDTNRANYISGYKERLEGYLGSGFISQAEYESELQDIEKWDYDRALHDIGNNPQGAAQGIQDGNYNLEANEANELVNVAISSARRQDKIRSLAQLERHNGNEAGFMERIYTDREIPVAHKIAEINSAELQGEISDDFAVKARRYLTSTEKLGAESAPGEVSQIVRMMYDANERLDNSFGYEANEDYLKKIQAIQHTIVDSPALSEHDRSTLLKELQTTTKKKQSAATIEMSRQMKYRAADEYFKARVPSIFRDEALRTYFYQAQGKELSNDEQRVLMQDIEVKIKYGKRQGLLDGLDAAREQFGPTADIRLEVVDGNPTMVMYKDGKRLALRAPGQAKEPETTGLQEAGLIPPWIGQVNK